MRYIKCMHLYLYLIPISVQISSSRMPDAQRQVPPRTVRNDDDNDDNDDDNAMLTCDKARLVYRTDTHKKRKKR